MQNPLLQAEKVAFYYPQDRRGLTPISINLSAGEGVLVRGSSGSGKSTFARCLSGLIPHLYRGIYEGKVWIKGRTTEETPLWELAEQVGMVFQNPAFQMLAPTVENEILFGLENLGLSREEMKERLDEVLSLFQLDSFRNRSPISLSGGEQQKLTLASILARKPEMLILDEPLSMLDTTSAQEFVRSIGHSINQGTTYVVCEHREKYFHDLSHMRTLSLNGSNHIDSTEYPDPIHFPYESPSYSLQVNDLSVEIGGKSIIRNLDFSLQGGQLVAVVGRNGAGKTTLFRALCGLQKSNGSRLIQTLNGQEVPKFSMIFQNPDVQLFNPTVREEILYKVDNPDMNLYSWLIQALNLKRYEVSPPLLLSEGEKRRVALATALMQRAKHGVLFDEPSLGQDHHHKQILLRLMRALTESGYLVMFSTHDLELAAGADHVILLKSDGIISQGTSQEVFSDNHAWSQIGLVRPEWMALPCFA